MRRVRAINLASPIEWGHPLNRGLVSAWLPIGNGRTGSRLFDLAGRNHGTLVNGPTWRPGRTPGFGALTFDGVDERVTVANSGSLNSIADATWIVVLYLASVGSDGGAFLKVGGDSTGIGLGVGGTTFDNTGSNLILLREGAAWHVTGATLTTGWNAVAFHTLAVGCSAFYKGTKYGGYGAPVATVAADPIHFGGYTAGATNRYAACTIESVWRYPFLEDARVHALSAALLDQSVRGYLDLLRRVPISRSFVGSGTAPPAVSMFLPAFAAGWGW